MQWIGQAVRALGDMLCGICSGSVQSQSKCGELEKNFNWKAMKISHQELLVNLMVHVKKENWFYRKS